MTAYVIDRGATDVDLHLLRGEPTGERCIARHDRTVTANLTAGTYYVVVDTFLGKGGAHPGEFLLAVVAD